MMGRQPRLVADGLVCHARNRGNNRPAVVSDDADRATFRQALGQTTERYPFRRCGLQAFLSAGRVGSHFGEFFSFPSASWISFSRAVSMAFSPGLPTHL